MPYTPTEDNDHPPMRLIKRRLLVNTKDRTSGTTSDFSVAISPALQNIVSYDWVYSYQTGFLMSVEELSSTGRTTGGFNYWRFMSEQVNSRYEKTQEAFETPRNFETLTFHFRAVDGTAVNLGEFSFELVFWEKLN